MFVFTAIGIGVTVTISIFGLAVLSVIVKEEFGELQKQIRRLSNQHLTERELKIIREKIDIRLAKIEDD